MYLLLLLMAFPVQVRQAWILPVSSPLRAAPRSNAPAVTVAGSFGEGNAGIGSSVVRARLNKPIGLMLAQKEIRKPGQEWTTWSRQGAPRNPESCCGA
ncbi:unnamed protein product [Ectocarpus sp. CCAP 1310/34]|nr:unnamed protein product [Ectocarpus sp. CCAP 1310/34]